MYLLKLFHIIPNDNLLLVTNLFMDLFIIWKWSFYIAVLTKLYLHMLKISTYHILPSIPIAFFLHLRVLTSVWRVQIKGISQLNCL